MQGVAFDSQVVAAIFNQLDDEFQPNFESNHHLDLFKNPAVKVINMSWGIGFDWDNYFNKMSDDQLLKKKVHPQLPEFIAIR